MTCRYNEGLPMAPRYARREGRPGWAVRLSTRSPALAWLALSGVAVAAACVQAGDANAERAYYELDGDLLSRAALAKALATVERARQANPRDPWAYATQSYVVLADGYQIGDRYSLKSYDPAAVDRALGLAARAAELGPSTSLFHAHLARIQVIKGVTRRSRQAGLPVAVACRPSRCGGTSRVPSPESRLNVSTSAGNSAGSVR